MQILIQLHQKLAHMGQLTNKSNSNLNHSTKHIFTQKYFVNTIHVNSKTLGSLFTATQLGIFYTRFKAFETKFIAKTSLRTFLTIYMALSRRLTQVGKDPYLLELSELHQIGAHASSSPRRATFLLAPSKTDDPIGQKPREATPSLSKNEFQQPLHKTPLYCSFLVFKNGEDNTMQVFVFFLINNFQNSL